MTITEKKRKKFEEKLATSSIYKEGKKISKKELVELKSYSIVKLLKKQKFKAKYVS